MVYCQNCGHDCHCGSDCMQNYHGNGQFKCCGNCRHEEKKINRKNDGSLDEDSFNGA